MVVRIAGQHMSLWRAVDDEGEVLDMLVQQRRNTTAALNLIKSPPKNQAIHPESLTTDGLGSYRVTARDLNLAERHHSGCRHENNRAGHWHLPIRRRERKQQRFKSQGSAQCFLATHSVSLPPTAPSTMSSTTNAISSAANALPVSSSDRSDVGSCDRRCRNRINHRGLVRIDAVNLTAPSGVIPIAASIRVASCHASPPIGWPSPASSRAGEPVGEDAAGPGAVEREARRRFKKAAEGVEFSGKLLWARPGDAGGYRGVARGGGGLQPLARFLGDGGVDAGLEPPAQHPRCIAVRQLVNAPAHASCHHH
jgi:hypothetical protein